MNYEKPKVRPEVGVFHSFDHLVFWVGNAKTMAAYFTSRLGMEYYAYRGLETGEKQVACHVVKSNNLIFELQSGYEPCDSLGINAHVAKHGDAVRDVAFNVDDAKGIYNKAISRGAKSVREPQELTDEHGTVIVASIATYGDTIHTMVQRNGYKGFFLPGYIKHPLSEPLNKLLPETGLSHVDHVVGNHPDGEMEIAGNWYEKMLDWHRFWSVDESVLHTEYSALRSLVMADFDENCKMPNNEPAPGKKRSQIQEYVDYYAGSGVQHIALYTNDLLTTINALRNRGVDFLEIPKTYYSNLRKNIPNMTVKIEEDIDEIERLRILVDYDDKGYLLQLFTKPIMDRPTVFFEFIQRHNNNGFGVGNFKSLFQAIEDEQALRGNLF
jgi:4-hydroxyphenylpyruvate dioxygenase